MAGGDREVRELYGPGACVAYIWLRGRSLLKRVEGEQYGWVKRGATNRDTVSTSTYCK